MAGNRDPEIVVGGKKVLIVLTDGFEEIEAITPIDILRRAGLDVIVAGLEKIEMAGSHGIKISADLLLKDVKDTPDAIVLPGGPGAEQLGKSKELLDTVKLLISAGKTVGAICAAPAVVLGRNGFLRGKKATCFPGYEKELETGGAVFSAERVVTDGFFVTSRGAGTAMEFSLELVRKLMGSAKANEISETILARA
jgi:4-methyl-5(b-hydroxyethyl)-thiazole monophosphate biosynthesis